MIYKKFVAIGDSQSVSMTNADIIFLSYNGSSTTVGDYFGTGHVAPTLD